MRPLSWNTFLIFFFLFPGESAREVFSVQEMENWRLKPIRKEKKKTMVERDTYKNSKILKIFFFCFSNIFPRLYRCRVAFSFSLFSSRWRLSGNTHKKNVNFGLLLLVDDFLWRPHPLIHLLPSSRESFERCTASALPGQPGINLILPFALDVSPQARLLYIPRGHPSRLKPTQDLIPFL